MPIFGNLENEGVVQVGDRTRLSAEKTFVTQDMAAITMVEIRPEASADYIAMTSVSTSKDWNLDWMYSSPGNKTASLRVTSGTAGPSQVVSIFEATLTVVTASVDALFSADKDLLAYEPDIMRWVPKGRSTYLNVHRKAQELILNWIDQIRLYGLDSSTGAYTRRLTAADLKVTDDLRHLSTVWALEIIYSGIWNKQDDAFFAKFQSYQSLREAAQQRGRVQADLDEDGVLEPREKLSNDMRSMRMVRR